MTAVTGRAGALRAARAADSAAKRTRAREAIGRLEAAGTPVTATAVARAAGVSTWLIYADGVREHLDAARHRQARPSAIQARPAAGDAPPTPASLRTDLALAREEIRRLRTEHSKLRDRLRLRLGAEIDGPDPAVLITRVADLETLARKLTAERDARAAEAHQAQRRIRDLEDDLTAARETLRKVIKDNNRPRA
jgi:Family of unknown function (DUF6262)